MGKLGKLALGGAVVAAIGAGVVNAVTAEGTPRAATKVAEFLGLDDCTLNHPNGPEVTACRAAKARQFKAALEQKEAAEEAEKED